MPRHGTRSSERNLTVKRVKGILQVVLVTKFGGSGTHLLEMASCVMASTAGRAAAASPARLSQAAKRQTRTGLDRDERRSERKQPRPSPSADPTSPPAACPRRKQCASFSWPLPRAPRFRGAPAGVLQTSACMFGQLAFLRRGPLRSRRACEPGGPARWRPQRATGLR